MNLINFVINVIYREPTTTHVILIFNRYADCKYCYTSKVTSEPRLLANGVLMRDEINDYSIGYAKTMT